MDVALRLCALCAVCCLLAGQEAVRGKLDMERMCMGYELWPLERRGFVSYLCTRDERGSLRRQLIVLFHFSSRLGYYNKNGTNGLLHLSFLLLEYLLLIVVEDHYDCNNRLLTIPFSAIFNGSRCNAIYLAYSVTLVSCAPLYCGQIGTLIDRIGVPEYAPGW